MAALPLSGIRVLDLSRLLPGPYLTQLLSDLGAVVIKVETPLAGDHTRLAPPEMGLGNMYEAINQGKKSLALNYRNPRGRELFLQLAKTAAIVLEDRLSSRLQGQAGYRLLLAFRLWTVRPVSGSRRP
jgi:crotonobetainyl-CoA:carnitine CoA-transferase CaiB-like acyl-CoA transferase